MIPDAPTMTAVAWSDYLCPWCYVGQARDRLLESLGVTITHLPYELHPEIPLDGFRLGNHDGRKARAVALYERLAGEAAQAGMELRRPARLPNTRRALGTAEFVRRHHPDAFPALHAALFDAVFVTGDDISDPDTVDALTARSGLDPDQTAAARDAIETGVTLEWLRDSMTRAADVGVGGTPAWWVEERLLIPGLQSEDWITRVITKLRSRLAT